MTDDSRPEINANLPEPHGGSGYAAASSAAARPSLESLLADAHNLPDELPGDELGGGFENGEQLVPGKPAATPGEDPSAV